MEADQAPREPWIEPTLAGAWLVRVKPSARAKNLARRLPDLLRDLERDGRRVVSGNQASTDQASVIAGQLGIVQAVQVSTERPGSIYVMPPERPLPQMGGYSPATSDPLAHWLSEWVSDPSRADNLRKLERSDAPERHLFILVPGFNSGSFAVSDLLIAPDAPLPTIPPVLPAEITHAWAASTWDSGDGSDGPRTRHGNGLPRSSRRHAGGPQSNRRAVPANVSASPRILPEDLGAGRLDHGHGPLADGLANGHAV
jgi:hypothetical protein